MKVVVDTNVYVSALVFGGVPRVSLMALKDQPFQLVVSHEIRAELSDTLRRKFNWSQAQVTQTFRTLWAEAECHKPTAVRSARDPNDDHVLGCALAACAEIIMTGDKDLLVLHPFRKIAILTPLDFLTLHAPGGYC